MVIPIWICLMSLKRVDVLILVDWMVHGPCHEGVMFTWDMRRRREPAGIRRCGFTNKWFTWLDELNCELVLFRPTHRKWALSYYHSSVSSAWTFVIHNEWDMHAPKISYPYCGYEPLKVDQNSVKDRPVKDRCQEFLGAPHWWPSRNNILNPEAHLLVRGIIMVKIA